MAVKFFSLGMRDLRHIIWEILPKEIRSHLRLVTIRVYLVAWGCLRASRGSGGLYTSHRARGVTVWVEFRGSSICAGVAKSADLRTAR